MRNLIPIAIAIILLAACRGEKVPRDYQNAPPAMMHPAKSSTQTPAGTGTPGATPEPSKGAEGSNITGKPTTALPPADTLGNQAPTTTTHT